MLGQMMSQPLLISSLIAHAEKYHSEGAIHSVNTGGGVEETSWGQVAGNARRLASALAGIPSYGRALARAALTSPSRAGSSLCGCPRR